jgi:hypothetical protein
MTSVNRYLVSALPKFGIPKSVFTRHSVPSDNGLGEIIESLGTLDPKILAAKIALADDPKDVKDEAKSLILDTSHSWNDLTANNPNLAIILPIGEQKVSLVRANGNNAKPVSIRFFHDGLETVFNPDDNPDFRLEPFKNKHLDEIEVGSPIYNDLKELVLRYEVQAPEARTQTLELMNEIIKPFAEQSKTKRQSNTFNSILMEHPFSPNIDLVIKLDNKGKLTDILIYEPLASSAELENPDFFLVARSAT